MPETLFVQAELPALARVRDWTDALGERLSLPPSSLFAIHLCFEEAVSNIIHYGFGPGEGGAPPDKEVRLTLKREDGAIIATIEDHGVAFDPLAAAAPSVPATIEEATGGGLGIPLMRRFAQHLAYERRDGMNRLTLRFALA